MIINNLDILNKLQLLKRELIEKYHIKTIGVFGSVLRTDFKDSSDIDILVEFSKPIGIEFVDLGDYLESILKRKVDLVSKNGIKSSYFALIEKEIIYV